MITRIVLSNKDAIELLEVVTDADYGFDADPTVFTWMCELLALLSGEENHQGLMLTPVDPIEDETDETFDFVSDNAGCPTGNCPVLMPPQLEQMG